MRWPTVLVLIVALASCKLPTTTGGGGGAAAGAGTTGAGTAGGGGASVCNTAATCSDCVKCALVTPCATLYNNCLADPDCNSIDQCFASCSDTNCQANCYANNPNGMSAYQTVNKCVYCNQCPKECPGQCM